MAKNQIRFPILNDVDYLDIIKNKQTIVTYTKKDCENLKWRDLQKKIGRVVNGLCVYNLKFNNSDIVHKGTIRSINSTQPMEQNETKNDPGLLNQIEQLNNKINSIGQNSGVSVDLLLSISKQSYETQINFLNAELIRKENFIDKLQKKIDELETELDEAAELIEDYKSKSGAMQYLDIAKTFLSAKMGTAQKITSLKDSNTSDIPEKILLILGAVDWSKVPDEVLNTIIQYLEIYITKLPMKG